MQIKCRCGESSMEFAKLTLKDLPNGWDGDCCAELTGSFSAETLPEEAIEQDSEKTVPAPVETKAQRKAREKAEREAKSASQE